jgi:hypothetical protein
MDTIAAAEACVNGAKLNWCKFLMNEMFQVRTDAYHTSSYFIFGYLLLAFAMFKWMSPQGRELTGTPGRTILALKYEPWSGKEIYPKY